MNVEAEIGLLKQEILRLGTSRPDGSIAKSWNLAPDTTPILHSTLNCIRPRKIQAVIRGSGLEHRIPSVDSEKPVQKVIYVSPSDGSEIIQLSQQGRLKEAVDCLEQDAVQASLAAYVSLLRSCGNAKALSEGRRVHNHIKKQGTESIYLQNLVVEMYAKCRDIKNARAVFDNMSKRNIFSWTTIFVAYIEENNEEEALHLYKQMKQHGVKADKVAFITIVQGCHSPKNLFNGRLIHACIVDSGFELDVIVRTVLVNMYGQCGSLEDACRLFENFPMQNIVYWNAMTEAHIEHGRFKEALQIFRRMQEGGLKPDKIAFITALKACVNPWFKSEGRLLHASIIDIGFEFDIALMNSLVNMYGKCGQLIHAQRIFDSICWKDLISYNTMIGIYAKCQERKCALKLLQQMISQRVAPNEITFGTILPMCADLGTLSECRLVHAHMFNTIFESDVIIGTTLISMYGKFSSFEDAGRVFKKITGKNVISWNAIIAVLAQQGHAEEALYFFKLMQMEGIKPIETTFGPILSACADLIALSEGRMVHNLIVDNGFDSNVILGNALVHMYGKCGKLEDAAKVFGSMPGRDVISWNVMIAACAYHGQASKSLYLFREMQQSGIAPDNITIVKVLSACAHASEVDFGSQLLVSMSRDHCIPHTAGHSGCMIDILGRAGYLDEAEDFLENMVTQPDVVAWRALLAASTNYGDVKRGCCAAEHVIELDSSESAVYVLLSNIYAAIGRWDDVIRVRKAMSEKGVRKQPGYSSVEVNNKVHKFLACDMEHPEREKIYEQLEKIIEMIKKEGYEPDTKLVLHDVEDEVKEALLSYHSEKLAITYGLMSTPYGTPLRIIKNLRVCRDCHHAMKYISKLMEREIIMRDTNRFHQFKDGVCSCGDYW